jgi:hypothetical protein
VAPLEFDCRAVRIRKDEEKVGVGVEYGQIAKKNLAVMAGFLQ